MKRVIIYIILSLSIFIGCSGERIESKEKTNPKISYGLESSLLEKKVITSSVLKKDMNINVYLPKGYTETKNYPVLYMLHGYGTNEDTWMPDLMLNKKADELILNEMIEPLVIVAPGIDNSFGINSSDQPGIIGTPPDNSLNEGRYSDYIINEVISYIDNNYSTIAAKEGRYIGGLSMGGFAALHIAFNNTNLFSKVGGHSPALYLETESEVVNWLYPNEEIKKQRDPIQIAQESNLKDIKVYLDCGDEDYFQFYKGCEKLNFILESKGTDTQYHINSGKHEGIYWASNTEKYLKFYSGI